VTCRVKEFNRVFIGSWKEGHLLNALLGGPGDDSRNLTAISSSTNSMMSEHYENELISKINHQRKWMHYKLDVTHSRITRRHTTLADDDLYWASKIAVSYGEIDKDGAPTGDTKKVNFDIPQPIKREDEAESLKKDKKTNKTNSQAATGNTNPVAEAERDPTDVDIILTSEQDVKSKIEEKIDFLQQHLYLQRPLSPRRQLEVDVEMQKEYPDHVSMSQTYREVMAEGGSDTQAGITVGVRNSYVNRTKFRKAYRFTPYVKKYQELVTPAQSKKEYNLPKQVFELLPVLGHDKFKTVSKDAYPELYEAIDQLFNVRVEKLFIQAVVTYYYQYPEKFQALYDALLSASRVA
jgi:hypothetical protein